MPGPDDLHRVGTVASILRYVATPDGGHHVVSQGEQRFRIVEFLEGYPFLAARVERIADSDSQKREKLIDKLLAEGVGEAFPVDPADPKADVNRRVEFQVGS